MVFKNFKVNLLIKVLLISIFNFITIYLGFYLERYYSATFSLIITGFLIYDLYQYGLNTNHKLIYFLDSIRNDDFSLHFSSDNKLGKSFRELNNSFNQVMEVFRKIRSEREENLHFLNTVVQHVGIGLLSLDQEGNVGILNNAACRMLRIPRFRNMDELKQSQPELLQVIRQLQAGSQLLFPYGKEQQLVIDTTEIRLQRKIYKLISFQDIHPELQKKELEAWQNLSRVLRHEIMNSITPITSMITTLRDIAEYDLIVHKENEAILSDMKSALKTIETRSQSLMKFVNNYRNFTSIPKPKYSTVLMKDIMRNVVKLQEQPVKGSHVQLHWLIKPSDLSLTVDPGLVEMVLINLVKNSLEATKGMKEAQIELKGYRDGHHHAVIEVIDNGPGVSAEALEKIFIPFYSTKRTGSGIGLSLSRQIMQLHRGSLTVNSEVGQKTVFTLRF
jgi:two-component system nitrogen regulation sensor histidine kinase NtrY